MEMSLCCRVYAVLEAAEAVLEVLEAVKDVRDVLKVMEVVNGVRCLLWVLEAYALHIALLFWNL